MLRAWVTRLRERIAALTAHVTRRVDEHKKRDGEAWGASMEYKRRYTNPDDAKRHRAPPREKS